MRRPVKTWAQVTYDDLPPDKVVIVNRQEAMVRSRNSGQLLRRGGGIWHECAGKVLGPAEVMEGLVEDGLLVPVPLAHEDPEDAAIYAPVAGAVETAAP